MRLHVTLPYNGVQRGEYEHTDSALNGLAEYLVTSGHAHIVSGSLEDITNEPTETVSQETATESDTSTLQALRDEYETVAGKRWYHGWDEETLQAKIDELEGL